MSMLRSHGFQRQSVVLWGTILLLFLLWGRVLGIERADSQNIEIGTPVYRIHDLTTLGTGYRISQLCRDRYGRIILLTGGKLWIFDGNEWNPFGSHQPNSIPITGIATSATGEIYIGASGDWGIMKVDSKGNHYFESRKDVTSELHQSVREDFFNVSVFPSGVGYMGENAYVFMAEDGNIQVFPDYYRLTTQFYLNDGLYVCSEREGITRILDGKILRTNETIIAGQSFISASCMWDDSHALLGTNGAGLFLFDGETIEPFKVNFHAIDQYRILDIVLIENQYVAITLDNWGVVILDKEGNYVNSINSDLDPRFIRTEKLHYNEDGTLWVSVAMGIAQVFFPSPLTILNHHQKLSMAWPSVCRYKGELLVKSNRVVYKAVYNDEKYLTHFEKLDIFGENRMLESIFPVEDGILFSDLTGVYLKKDDGREITITKDFTSRYFHEHPDNKNVIFMFNHEGIFAICKEGDRWVYKGDFLEAKGSFNQLCYRDKEGYFWTERGIGKIVRFKLDEGSGLIGRVFTTADGLSENNWVNLYEIDGECYISDGYGHRRYDFESKEFHPAPEMQRIEDKLGMPVSRPYRLPDGDMLLPTNDGIVVFREGEKEQTRFDFLTFAAFSEFNPLILDTGTEDIWLRTESSLVKYDPSIPLLQNLPTHTYIQRVEIPGKGEVLFSIDQSDVPELESLSEFQYDSNGLSFHFFTPALTRIYPVKHRYFLEGFSTEWTELSNELVANFVGIWEGEYTFLVQSVDHFGKQGELTRFSFVIHPPWYRSILAYIVYVLGVLTIMVVVVVVNRRSVATENRRLEHLVKERTEKYEKAAIEAREASKAKSQFLANMSHEIRTPINGIIGSSELISIRNLDRGQRELVHIIQTSAKSLMGIVEGVLEFAKIEAHRLNFKRSKFDLETLIFESLEVVSNFSMKKGVELFYHIDRSLNSILFGDINRLRQVLINLLENAIKFTDEGYVFVECKPGKIAHGKQEILFSVKDTGIGIDLENAGNLFEPFYQIDNSNTRDYGGTGMGLAICRRIVNLMAGSIKIESEPGKGTCVKFSVRLAYTDKIVKSPEGNMKRDRVLLVDPIALRRACLKEFITLHNMDVTDVETFGEGLKILSDDSRSFDYVLLNHRETIEFTALNKILLTQHLNGKLRGFAIFSNPDIQFSSGMARYVVPKPWSYPAVCRHMLSFDQDKECSEINEALISRSYTYNERFQQSRVLIVEDNRVNHRVFDLLIKRMGFHSDHAWNGREATEMCLETNYEIVFMDIQMPEMDGLEASLIIKSFNEPPYIIGITANAQDADRQQAMEAKMDDFLTKPVYKEELFEAINRFLEIDRDVETG